MQKNSQDYKGCKNCPDHKKAETKVSAFCGLYDFNIPQKGVGKISQNGQTEPAGGYPKAY